MSPPPLDLAKPPSWSEWKAQNGLILYVLACARRGSHCPHGESLRHIRTTLVFAITVVVSIGTTGHLHACDPNENCYRCLASAFGRCITKGNDPVCQARKAICRVPVAGPILTMPGTPLAPGGPLGPGGPGIGPLSGEDVKRCFRNPAACPAAILSNSFYDQFAVIMDQYIQFLWRQGNGRWQNIPDNIAESVAGFYPGVNLLSVRYATGVNTLHGQAITIGNNIFFPEGDLDLSSRDDLKLLFHELEHSEQYARRGGVRPFLAEYVAKVPGKVIQKRRFNIHDDVDIERAAISKSEHVVRSYYGWDFHVENACSHPARFALRYYNTDETWKTISYWELEPHETFFLSDNSDGLIHTKNALFYWYAETTDDSNLTWRGDHLALIDGRQLAFRTTDLSGTSPTKMTVKMTCQ